MKKTGVLKSVGCVCAILAVALSSNGQTVYPPTITVPVTYFDYHSDGSNPDFNEGTSPNMVVPGMVRTTLDQDGLPVGTTTYLYSWGMGKWFRAWPQSQLGQGSDFLRPSYGALLFSPPAGSPLLGVNTVGRLNETIANREIDGFIMTAEALHEKKLARIADQIASARNRLRVK